MAGYMLKEEGSCFVTFILKVNVISLQISSMAKLFRYLQTPSVSVSGAGGLKYINLFRFNIQPL